MKTKYFSGIIFIALIFLASCDSWINSDLNVDPTSPKDASLNVILPTTQAGLSYVAGGDFYRQLGVINQHFTGIGRQHLGYNSYQFNETSFDNAWTTLYTGPMNDLYIIMDKAKALESPHYVGVAKVLMAFTLGMVSDLFGDIPYSEAFLGNDNLKPKFDSQEDIYNTIDKLLNEAIEHFGTTASNYKPGNDDFIYKGNLTKWTKAAYTLKARYYLHTKKFSEALTALQNGFTENADDLQFVHGGKEAESNPLYQFMAQRGDITIGVFLINEMNKLNDPRRAAYAYPDADDNFSEDSEPGPYYASINSPVPFCTYAEAKFIEAELQFRQGSTGNAYTAYIDAIKASCQKHGVADADIETYIAQDEVGLGGDDTKITLQHIMMQKYIALYYNSESWSDWRRTGIPDLKPTTGNDIPRRMYYPQVERLFNFTNLVNVAPNYNAPGFIFQKMWWDSLW